MKKILFFYIFLFFTACELSDNYTTKEAVESDKLYFPPLNSNDWERISLTSLGWNENSVTDLERFLINSGTKAFIILKNGKIVLKKYYNGFSQNEKHPWFSAGKTLTAFATGQIEQDNYISINDKVSEYLGLGWTQMPTEKENLIKIKHLLTMTSGGDYTQGNIHCTDASCLFYLEDAGNLWYYHNAFYTLIQEILNKAVPEGFDNYFNRNLKLKIGMKGFWLKNGYNRFYVSDARSMARFGILNLNKGAWNGQQLLNLPYIRDMTTTSQNLNKSYGYLWWLNGKDSKRLPGSSELFLGQLAENAPSDLIAGLGANDQKLYVVPSENLVIVRFGEDGGTSNLGPSTYDNLLWEKLNALMY